MSREGHNLNVLSGIKTAIYRGETERLQELIDEHDYTAVELRQFADIADMVDQPTISENLREQAQQKN